MAKENKTNPNEIRGFESFTKLKKNIRGIKQLYDLTYHLYQVERIKIKRKLPTSPQETISFPTSNGEISHSYISMYQRLKGTYPFQLRQLLLINAITILEVYLTDVIFEVFKRDINPFKESKSISIQKDYLLHINSITKLQEKLIKKDIRQLTSGGLKEIKKYYNKTFGIEFKELGISYDNLYEIHVRRHLFVHRNGKADLDYCRNYPLLGFKEGNQINIEHKYFINSINLLYDFAKLVNNELLKSFPKEIRKAKYIQGEASFDFEHKNLMMEIGLENENYDYNTFFNNLIVREKELKSYIVQLTLIDKTLFLFLSGNKEILSSFYYPIKSNNKLTLLKTIEIKNNVS